MWKWAGLGLRVLSAIVGGVHMVESLASSKRGQDKQDAAVEAVRAMLGIGEQVAGRDLLNDRDVELATRTVIDAYVALQKVIESKAGTAAIAPAGG